jgi:hypothetical protein
VYELLKYPKTFLSTHVKLVNLNMQTKKQGHLVIIFNFCLIDVFEDYLFFFNLDSTNKNCPEDTDLLLIKK